jgi:hypothetical protein
VTLLSDNLEFKIKQVNFFFIIYLFLSLIPDNSISQPDSSVLLREDFNDLSAWENMYIGAKKARTDYQIINDDSNSYLQIKSSESASGILWNIKFNPYESPFLKWRWKVDTLISGSDGQNKLGDDYAVRIFILFAQDSSEISFWQKIRNTTFRILYGYDPPHSGLILVWANIRQDKEYFQNPYDEDLMVWNIRQGAQETERWLSEEVNIIELFKRSFGKMPPKIATLAIMGDSDNTAKSSLAFIDFIEIAETRK